MKRNYSKLILDIAMLIVLLLSFRHNSINQSFHEIAGFALMGGVLLHLMLNRKQIAGVSRRFFRQKLPVKTRIGCIVNVLLLCCFIAVGISGAMISKVVFSLNGGAIWKTVHYFASALLLILLGIHLGLHLSFFANTVGRHIKLPRAAARALCIVLTLGIFAWGCRSIVSTSFVQWLSIPFAASETGSAGARGNGFEGHDSEAPALNDKSADSTLPSDNAVPADMPALAGDNTAASGTDGGTDGGPDGSGFAKGGRGGGDFGGRGESEGFGGEGGGFSPVRAFSTLADFFSIAFVFAALTRCIEWLTGRRKKATHPAEPENACAGAPAQAPASPEAAAENGRSE